MMETYELLDTDGIRKLQGAYDAIKELYDGLYDEAGKRGMELGVNWHRDGLTEEEWAAKPLDERLYEVVDHLAFILVECDPAGEAAR